MEDSSSTLNRGCTHLIARRYALKTLIGRGGSGEVWRAEDRLVGRDVACKVLNAGVGVRAARALREVALLRRLRLPGVVALLDEGVEDGRRYLIMELISGEPFPSRGETRSWEELAPIVLGLLQVLARVHDAGVVHRDLKPENVLIDSHGRPTLLDFGISWEVASEQLTVTGDLVGTPMYVAPEQVLNERVTHATDLYALGVMLYEALTGVRPFGGEDVRSQVFSRLFGSPQPLRVLRPEVAPPVEALVMDLLRREPAQRPRSARDAARRVQALIDGSALRGVSLPDGGAFDAASTALREVRAVSLVGPRGSGRTHTLRRLRAEMTREGVMCVSLGPGDEPFRSVIGALSPGFLDGVRSGEVERRVCDALRGAVVFGDDAERIDPWTLQLLRAATPDLAGLVLAWTDLAPDDGAARVMLRALSLDALRQLFDGPELLFHVGADAARALHQRTGGMPGLVITELDAWLRGGIATLHDGRLRVAQSELQRLRGWHDETVLEAAPSFLTARVSVPPLSLTAPLIDALRWIVLLHPEATEQRLESLLERPAWDVSLRVERLLSEGLVSRDEGRLRPSLRASASVDTDLDRLSRARLIALLPDGSPRRLALLLAMPVNEVDQATLRELGRALHARAREVAGDGHTAVGLELLHEGVLCLRNIATQSAELARSASVVEHELLALWLEIAVAEGSPAAVQRHAYELSRAMEGEGVPSTERSRLRELSDIARDIETKAGEMVERLGAMVPFDVRGLERVRLNLWVRAARVRSTTEESELLDHLLTHYADGAELITAGLRAAWSARLYYRQGRFRESAEQYALAAREAQGIIERLTSLLACASSWLEAFAFERARAAAMEALSLAVPLRHAMLEARSHWILRAAAYRHGEVLAVDHALLEALTVLNVPYIDGLITLNEAAIAWRTGADTTVAALGRRAQASFARAGMRHGTNLARALLLVVPGEDPADGEVESLANWCVGCDIPGIGIQAAGLLASRFATARRALSPHVDTLASQVPRDGWRFRAEVISVDEARRWLVSEED